MLFPSKSEQMGDEMGDAMGDEMSEVCNGVGSYLLSCGRGAGSPLAGVALVRSRRAVGAVGQSGSAQRCANDGDVTPAGGERCM